MLAQERDRIGITENLEGMPGGPRRVSGSGIGTRSQIRAVEKGNEFPGFLVFEKTDDCENGFRRMHEHESQAIRNRGHQKGVDFLKMEGLHQGDV